MSSSPEDALVEAGEVPQGGYAFSFDESETIDVDIDASGTQTTVVPILFRKAKTQIIAQGTAFCISCLASGEAIYVTANHVVERLLSESDIEPFLLLPRGVDSAEERNDLRGVRIQQVSRTTVFGDVALVVANIYESDLPVTDKLRGMPLTLDSPVVGEYCMALGYPQQARLIAYSLVASRGMIEEVHPSRRDSALSTFPSFRTTGLYRAGMSGGPIIDIRGRVVGVIAHGTEAEDPKLVYGYGATIAALAELRLDLIANDAGRREYTFTELVQMRVFDIDGAVTLHRDEDGVTLDWNVDLDSGESPDS